MPRALEVLLVEDNPGDVELMKSALRKSSVATNVTVGRDGTDAIAILRTKEQHPPLPDIIFLDLNLPKKNGREVLKEIKQDPNLKQIPVVVMTSSQAPEDIAAAYSLGTNCYLTKSVDFAESRSVIRLVEDFWFRAAHLPTWP